MSNLIKHAERELSLIGYDGNDELNNKVKAAIIELLTTFANQRHSGSSANYVIDILLKLASFKTLSPLTGNDDEWNDVSEMSGYTLFQNNRDISVFKDENGCFCVDAVVWIREDGSFTNKNSIGYIKAFPFAPKTFYVNVDDRDNILDTEEYDKAKEYYVFKH